MGQRVLVIGAHPDDEVIFFWPVLLGSAFQCELLICSSDENNPMRERYRRRKDALARVCDFLSIPFTCLPYPSEFYRLPQRKRAEAGDDIYGLIGEIHALIDRSPVDAVFTHNPHGEYGHADHRFVYRVVAEHARAPVWFSDIHLFANWPLGCRERTVSSRQGFAPHNRIFDAVMTPQIFDKYQHCERLYRHIDCWTWDRPPIKRCAMFAH